MRVYLIGCVVPLRYLLEEAGYSPEEADIEECFLEQEMAGNLDDIFRGPTEEERLATLLASA